MNFLFQFTGFGTINPGYLGGTGQYSTAGGGLAKFIANGINAIYIVGGIVFFIYLAAGGFRYITASGDAKQIQEATRQITNAIIGLAIIVGSYGAVSVLGSILGIKIFNPTFLGP